MTSAARLRAASNALSSHTSYCLNPACSNRCIYRHEGGGRQPIYCSVNCRVAYNRQRAQLRRIWAELQDVARDASAGQLLEVSVLQTQCRWALERYGGVSDPI